MNILKTIGHGPESVYVYYHENDKRLAELEHRPLWECKIGFTTSDVINRISEQTKTGRSSVPVIALIIKTDNASLLESFLHRALYEHRIPSTNHTGDEWFIINPNIIEEVYLSGIKPESTLRSKVEFIISSSEDLGLKLKLIRKSLKLVQEDMPLPRTTVNSVEKGQNIETRSLFKILEKLQYSLILVPTENGLTK
jgi:hypothetical protein